MINDVIDAIGTLVRTATGLRATELSDSPPVPCAMVYLDEVVDGYQAMRGGVFNIPIIVEPVVQSTSERSGIRAINDYVSPYGDRSIPLAILNAPADAAGSDTAAAGVQYTVSVNRIDDIGPASTGEGTRVWRAKIHLNVMVTRGSL